MRHWNREIIWAAKIQSHWCPLCVPSMRALYACPLCVPSMRALYARPLCVPSMRACRNAENLPNFCSGTAKSQLHRKFIVKVPPAWMKRYRGRKILLAFGFKISCLAYFVLSYLRNLRILLNKRWNKFLLLLINRNFPSKSSSNGPSWPQGQIFQSTFLTQSN